MGEMKVEHVLLLLVILFLLYFFMSNCGCRVEGFDAQYNFVYPKCTFSQRDHPHPPNPACISGKAPGIYYTTNKDAFSLFNGNINIPGVTVGTNYKIPIPAPGSNEDICVDMLTTSAVRTSDFHSKYGFKQGACGPQEGGTRAARASGDNSKTYDTVVHTGYADISVLGFGGVSVPYTVNKQTQDKDSCNTSMLPKGVSCESIFPENFDYKTSASKTGNTLEENQKLCNSSIDSKGRDCYVPEGGAYPSDKPICLTKPDKCDDPKQCSETFCSGNGACKAMKEGGEDDIKCDCGPGWSGEMCNIRTCTPQGGGCGAHSEKKCCQDLTCHVLDSRSFLGTCVPK